MAGFGEEFREFAMKGNVMDMAVGIIIGGAFGTVVKSFVADVLMPPIGMLIGDVNFQDMLVVLKEGATPGPYETLAAAQEAAQHSAAGRRRQARAHSFGTGIPVVEDEREAESRGRDRDRRHPHAREGNRCCSLSGADSNVSSNGRRRQR